MSEFTKGPWVVEGELIAQPADVIDSVEIAFMSELGGPMTSKTRKANANLIAAAPDLLEALEAALAALIKETAAGSHLSAEIAQARAAIAKARGV